MYAATLPPVVIQFEHLPDIKDSYTDLLWLRCGDTEIRSAVDGSHPHLLADEQSFDYSRDELASVYRELAAWLNNATILESDCFEMPLCLYEEAIMASGDFAEIEQMARIKAAFDQDDVVCREAACEAHRLIGVFLVMTNAACN